MIDKDEESFGSGTYTAHVYVVEAQSMIGECVLDGADGHRLILTPHDWKRVPITYGPVGVPNRLEWKQGFSRWRNRRDRL